MTPSDDPKDHGAIPAPERKPPAPERKPSESTVAPGRLAGAGFELGCFALLLGAMGHGVDRWLGFEDPIFAILGFLMGFAAGLYRLIKLASS
ncbi:MAG: AtpZ/AtpI family protein [Planctomycetota bacterium]